MVRIPNEVYEITIQIAEQCVQSNTKCSMYKLANEINIRTNNTYYDEAASSPNANEIGMYPIVKEAYWYAQRAYGTQKADFVRQVYVTKRGNPII